MRLLMAALLLAVAALSGVGFLSDRMAKGLVAEARPLLGGDAVVVSDQPLPQALLERARAMNLRTATSLGFPSMARADDAQGGASRLVAIKAVDAAYPLAARLGVQRVLDGPVEASSKGPLPGEVWVGSGLLETLGLALGDRLWLGEAALRVTAVLVEESDRGAGFMNFAPRVMMAAADLPATGLIQPASRVTYRLAVVAEPSAVAAFSALVQGGIAQGQYRGARLETLEGGRPEMRQTLDRAERFLRVVALMSVLLAAVAVGLAAHGHARSRLDACALLRVLGQSQAGLLLQHVLALVMAGAWGLGLGLALGWGLHLVLVQLLAPLWSGALPAPGWGTVGMSTLLVLTLLLAFGLAPVLQLAKVPALRVIRRDTGTPQAASVLAVALGLLGLGLLIWVVAGEPWLGVGALAGMAVAAAVLALAAGGVVWALGAALRREWGTGRWPRSWRLAARQVAARPGLTVVQVVAMGLGLMALCMLVLLRTHLVDTWQAATPATAPDRFVINIQPDQAADFQHALATHGVKAYDWYPMIRGRLVSVNGVAAPDRPQLDERARRLTEREFNLSHAAAMPAHNQQVSGAWATSESGLSVEAGLMQTLHLKLGDELVFDVAGVPVSTRITHVRQVDWASMRVNFFAMFTRADASDMPATWIAAFRQAGSTPTQRAQADAQLTRAFPNVTLVDVSASLAQVRAVLNQVVAAVEWLFVLTVLTGLVVLTTAIWVSREERIHDQAVMRALGAGRALMSQMQGAEMVLVGALAGALAATMALAAEGLLAVKLLDLPWQLPAWVWPVTMVAGAALAWSVGAMSLRQVLHRPVVDTLRQAAD